MNSILKKIIIVIWTFALIIPSVPVTAAETAEEPGKTDTLYIDVFIPRHYHWGFYWGEKLKYLPEDVAEKERNKIDKDIHQTYETGYFYPDEEIRKEKYDEDVEIGKEKYRALYDSEAPSDLDAVRCYWNYPFSGTYQSEVDNDYPFSKNYIWRVGDVPAKDGVNVGNDVNEAIEAGVKLYESYDELREDCPEKTRYTLSLEYWNSIKDNFDNVLPYWRNYGGGYSDYSESNYGDYYSILYYKTRAYYFSSMGDRIDPVGANHYYLSKYDNDEEWTKQNQSGYASYYNLGDIHWEWNDFTSGDINITYDVVFPGCKFPNNYDDLSADTEYRKNAIDYYKQYTDYKYYMGYAEAISEPYTGERHYQEDWVESVYWRRQKEKNIVKKIAQALEATTQKPQYSSFYKEDGVTYFEDKYDDLIAFTYDDENFYHVNYDMINCKEVYEENNIWYFVNDNYKYYIKDGLEYYEYPGYTYYKDANGQYHTIYPQGNDVENKKIILL